MTKIIIADAPLPQEASGCANTLNMAPALQALLDTVLPRKQRGLVLARCISYLAHEAARATKAIRIMLRPHTGAMGPPMGPPESD